MEKRVPKIHYKCKLFLSGEFFKVKLQEKDFLPIQPSSNELQIFIVEDLDTFRLNRKFIHIIAKGVPRQFSAG